MTNSTSNLKSSIESIKTTDSSSSSSLDSLKQHRSAYTSVPDSIDSGSLISPAVATVSILQTLSYFILIIGIIIGFAYMGLSKKEGKKKFFIGSIIIAVTVIIFVVIQAVFFFVSVNAPIL